MIELLLALILLVLVAQFFPTVLFVIAWLAAAALAVIALFAVLRVVAIGLIKLPNILKGMIATIATMIISPVVAPARCWRDIKADIAMGKKWSRGAIAFEMAVVIFFSLILSLFLIAWIAVGLFELLRLIQAGI